MDDWGESFNWAGRNISVGDAKSLRSGLGKNTQTAEDVKDRASNNISFDLPIFCADVAEMPPVWLNDFTNDVHQLNLLPNTVISDGVKELLSDKTLILLADID